jgi:hypothetical protein
MKNIFARGGIEFVAVFLGIILSLYVDQRRSDEAVKKDLLSDYIGIRNDLTKDLPYIKRLIKYWKEDVGDCNEIIKILDNESEYDYQRIVEIKRGKERNDGGSFYGTKTAYTSATSSGRLSYFGNNQLAKKIGNIYEHHYHRIEENGRVYDDFFINRTIRLNLGPRFNSLPVKEFNEQIIASNEYYINNELDCFIRKWILDKMEKASIDMEEVVLLLDSEINKL